MESHEIAKLQLVSKRFLAICRDDRLWRWRCFEESCFVDQVNIRRGNFVSAVLQGSDSRASQDESPVSVEDQRECARLMANWDPYYPCEAVCWYDEYIQRNAPLSIGWFQRPQQRSESGAFLLDARGFALYRPSAEPGMLLALSPLEDGSACLWDVEGTRGRPGSILETSSPGSLFFDGKGRRGRRLELVNSGVVECVAVDGYRDRAFVAVESRKRRCCRPGRGRGKLT